MWTAGSFKSQFNLLRLTGPSNSRENNLVLFCVLAFECERLLGILMLLNFWGVWEL